jgi:hypothetical protein
LALIGLYKHKAMSRKVTMQGVQIQIDPLALQVIISDERGKGYQNGGKTINVRVKKRSNKRGIRRGAKC